MLSPEAHAHYSKLNGGPRDTGVIKVLYTAVRALIATPTMFVGVVSHARHKIVTFSIFMTSD